MGGDAEGDDVMADTVATETASAVVGLLNCWADRQREIERGEGGSTIL